MCILQAALTEKLEKTLQGTECQEIKIRKCSSFTYLKDKN
jgi:hypothetical protein